MFSRLAALVLAGLGLMLSADSALATVQVVCAPGQDPVPSEGFDIVNGVIVFRDSACASEGEVLPPPLSITNIQVNPSTVDAGGFVTLSANLSNFITQPTPDTYDSCRVRVFQPNDTEVTPVNIGALSSVLQVTVPFAANAVQGQWSLRLACRRFVTNQEVILPQPAAVTVQVNSPVQPSACDNLPAPFVKGAVSEYPSGYTQPGSPTGGFGIAFGTLLPNWRDFTAANKYDANGDLSEVRVRSFRFTVPASGSAGLKTSSTSGSGGLAVSVSAQCGDYNVMSKCRATGGGQINWSTSPNPLACQLVPGQTYYLNFAYFRLAQYLDSGDVLSGCSCDTPNCVKACTFQNVVQSWP